MYNCTNSCHIAPCHHCPAFIQAFNSRGRFTDAENSYERRLARRMAPSSWAATHSVHHEPPCPTQRPPPCRVRPTRPRRYCSPAQRRWPAARWPPVARPRGSSSAETTRGECDAPSRMPCERRRGKSFAPRPPSDPAAVSSLQWRRGLQVADDGSAGHARQACADAVRSQLAHLLRYGLACAERSAARAWLAPRPETRVCVVPGLTSMCR